MLTIVSSSPDKSFTRQLFFLMLFASNSFGLLSAGPIVATFSRQTVSEQWFQHLVVDKDGALVYVGGVNRLYQLSPDLEPQVIVDISSKECIPDCLETVDCPAEAVIQKSTDNVNKALVIDYTGHQLIACGTLHQGTCSVRNLTNIGEELVKVRQPVVANSSTATTVAFIAPGPPHPPNTRVLYVGVTHLEFRSEVQAVSSRSLERDKMFQIAEMGMTSGTHISLHSMSLLRYPINYVFGFSSEGFSYFLTTQRSETTFPSYISKLIRICQNDSDYYSYIEVPLECVTEDGTAYNLVQAAYVDKPGSNLAGFLNIQTQDDVMYAAFAQSERGQGGEMSDRPSARSALCIYSLKSIRRKITQNIQKCFSGHGMRHLSFILPNIPCVKTKIETIGEDFCGLDVNSPLGGDEPVFERPIFTTNNVLLTAVVATSTGDFTVAFLGTSRGHLKKVVLDSVQKDIKNLKALEYDDIIVDEGSQVSSDLSWDQQRKNIYVLTERKITKIRVQECAEHSTCSDCLEARDPYCGWCSLEHKCSLHSDCRDAAKTLSNHSIIHSPGLDMKIADPTYWMSYESKKCATITSVKPNQLQRTSTAHTIFIETDNLPPSNEFKCAFNIFGKTLLTNATRTSDVGLRCKTPRSDHIPTNLPGQHYFVSQLSIRMKNDLEIASTGFTFFDCKTYTTCTECVTSPYPCNWCVDGHRCANQTIRNCDKEILINGINRIGVTGRIGPKWCPRINVTGNATKEILVPYGTKRSIQVKVENVVEYIRKYRLACQYHIEGKIEEVEAHLVTADTISCAETKFTYSTNVASIAATFTIIWNGSKYLENSENYHILIYRCKKMANNCGECLILKGKFQCGWCQTSNKCTLKDACIQNGKSEKSISVALKSAWLDRNQLCPNLKVFRFYPKLAPLEGGVNLTIEGVNFGRTLADIVGGVTVAGVPCHPYENLYERTRRIVCLVGRSNNNETRSGPVIVRVSSLMGYSKEDFQFVNPVIDSIYPSHGPLSGGTQLTIRGQFMNAGSSTQAIIFPELPCIISYINASYVVCRTSPSNRILDGELQMSFDQIIYRYSNLTYHYVDDPIINYTESGVISKIKVPKGIPSGGIIISVSGNNFEHIQEPKMYVRYLDAMYSSNCKVLSNKRMECRSPSIPCDQQISPDDPLSLDYGFLIDDVLTVRNLSHLPNFPKFLLYPDPIYEKFEEEVKYFKSDYLIINGLNLDRACQENDVEVTIGKAQCKVTSISRNQLTCRSPPDQPPAVGSDPGDKPEVVVVVGRNLRYVIGKLSYDTTNNKIVTTGVAIGCGVGLLALVAFMTVFRVCRRKTSNNLRLPKTMDERMNDNQEFILEKKRNTFPRRVEKLLKGNAKDLNKELPIEEQTELLSYDKRWEFPSYRLRLGTQLGAGCFGRVVKAEAVGIKGSGSKETISTVAVKMVRSQTNIEALEALVSELKILAYLGPHLNVLNLLGACTKNISKGELFIILEYCRFGNLQKYLIKHRDNFINQVDEFGNMTADKNKEETDKIVVQNGYVFYNAKGENNLPKLDPGVISNRLLSTKEIISWSFQIARGMGHLVEKNILHGDLAARNVLLADNGVVKVCDFGMSRKMYQRGDYEKQGEGLMPVRWMAPESLTDRIFSSQSDVWSYGILLWELFSLSKVPYADLHTKRIMKELANGYRMEKPNFAPNFIGEIMAICWKKEPNDRPTFSELERIIIGNMETSVSSYYLDLNVPYTKAKNKSSTIKKKNFKQEKLTNPEKCKSLPIKNLRHSTVQKFSADYKDKP